MGVSGNICVSQHIPPGRAVLASGYPAGNLGGLLCPSPFRGDSSTSAGQLLATGLGSAFPGGRFGKRVLTCQSTWLWTEFPTVINTNTGFSVSVDPAHPPPRCFLRDELNITVFVTVLGLQRSPQFSAVLSEGSGRDAYPRTTGRCCRKKTHAYGRELGTGT